MRPTRLISAVMIPLTLGALLTTAEPQEKGQGGYQKQAKPAAKQDKGKSESKGKSAVKVEGRAETSPGKARGQTQRLETSANARRQGQRLEARGKAKAPGNVAREVGGVVEPRTFRDFAVSNKHGQKLVGRAISTANRRGLPEDAFVIEPIGNRTRVLTKSGVLLLDLDDDRDIGRWRVVKLRDTDKEGAPSFCRSGAGHPVWGRQWCIDKGFGLGAEGDVRWARVLDLGDVVVRRPTSDNLTRDVLVSVLGDIVFNRLAAHAITLGLVAPLSGSWLGEPTGPRVLLLTSGDRPVAEIVDVNRDDRVDMLVVAVRP
jgi:hypothetical protein